MFSIARFCRNKVYSTLVTKPLLNRQYMKISDKMEDLLKKSDHIPHHYTLIYRERSYFAFTFGYHALNVITSLTLSMVVFYVYNEDVLRPNGNLHPLDRTSSSIRPGKKPVQNHQLVILVLVGIGLFFVAQTLRKRYAIRIYYSEKDKMYKAIFIGKIPFTTEHYSFPERCLTLAAKESKAVWSQHIYNTNNRKIMLFQDKFRTSADFQEMLKPKES